MIHLDSLGLLLSAANKWIFRQDMPKPSQIKVWDNLIVPVSRHFDRLTGYSLGRSIIAIYGNK